MPALAFSMASGESCNDVRDRPPLSNPRLVVPADQFDLVLFERKAENLLQGFEDVLIVLDQSAAEEPSRLDVQDPRKGRDAVEGDLHLAPLHHRKNVGTREAGAGGDLTLRQGGRVDRFPQEAGRG